MTTPIKKNGNFYIDKLTDDFYLCEGGEWVKKGKLFRASIIGFVSVEPIPYLDSASFELAPGDHAVRYYDDFSLARSAIFCEYPAHADCEIVLTDDLAGFLSSGTNVVCRASVSSSSQSASLAFSDVIVPANSPLWLVMPATADVALAGVRASLAGEPV